MPLATTPACPPRALPRAGRDRTGYLSRSGVGRSVARGGRDDNDDDEPATTLPPRLALLPRERVPGVGRG